MRSLTRAEQVGLDAYLVERGIPLLLLMESAGAALADQIVGRQVGPVLAGEEKKKDLSQYDTMDLLAGPGMNGGDLYVTARKLLAAEKTVRLWESQKASSLEEGIVFVMREAALAAGVICRPFSAYTPEKTLVVDGVLGTGYQPTRPLSQELEDALGKLKQAKEQGACIVACDLPSGIVTDTGEMHPMTVGADETVTFFAPKFGQMKEPALFMNGRLTLSMLELPPALVDSYFLSK